MPVSLTTVNDGDPIDYDALRTYTASIEHYINEGIVAGDLDSTAPWVRSTRVYKPDFYTGIVANARLVSGEVHWTQYGHGSYDRSVHHSNINTTLNGAPGTAGKYVVVDGMTRTFAVPEAISPGSGPGHMVQVAMDWYCHELGGSGTIDDTTYHVADFALVVDGDAVATTARPLFTASDDSGSIFLECAKQYGIRYPVRISTAGVHSIGLRIRMYSMETSAGEDAWRHVFVWGRTAQWSWFSR